MLTVVRQVSHDERSGATTVSHLEAVDVGAPDRVASLLDKAMRQRAVGATALNEHSSRSHMVFMLSISGAHAASGQSVAGARIRNPTPPASRLQTYVVLCKHACMWNMSERQCMLMALGFRLSISHPAKCIVSNACFFL